MHVVLLNQAFHPDVVATAQMAKDLADALVARGHSVSAVASRSIYGKPGAVLPGRERIDGIEVYRAGFSLFGKASIASRIADFALFYVLAAARVMTLPRPDVVVSFTTPPFISLIGLLCRLVRGSRAVYWVMDLYPDVPVACGVMKPNTMLTRWFEWLNRYLLRHADANVVLGRCMRDLVLAKGISSKKVHHIPVWSDLGDAPRVPSETNAFRQAWGIKNEFVVMYSGNFGIGHEAETICKAVRRLAHRDEIRFVFVGGGKRRPEVEAFVAEHRLANAQYYDYVPRERIDESLSAADLHLISLREGGEGIMVPSKLFGILALGRPGLFVGHPSSEIARILLESGSGEVLRQGDDAGLAAAIERLAADRDRSAAMGLSGREHLHGRYDKATCCRAFVRLLESVVDAPGAVVAEDWPTTASEQRSLPATEQLRGGRA